MLKQNIANKLTHLSHPRKQVNCFFFPLAFHLGVMVGDSEFMGFFGGEEWLQINEVIGN